MKVYYSPSNNKILLAEHVYGYWITYPKDTDDWYVALQAPDSYGYDFVGDL